MEGVPDWLVKWTRLVCDYILFEQNIFPTAFKDDYPGVPEESLCFDAKNNRDVKLQNVAITIDKVQHVLKRMQTEQPPLRTLTAQELYEAFWMKDDSLKDSLIKVFDTLQ
jgi:hypothetical protein